MDIRKGYLLLIGAFALVIAIAPTYFAGAQTWPFVGCRGCASSSPPPEIPQFIGIAYTVNENQNAIFDLGATPDANLVYVENDNNNLAMTCNTATDCSSAGNVTPSPFPCFTGNPIGPTPGCQMIRYMDFANNSCNRAPELAAYNAMNSSQANDSFSLHVYATPEVAPTRSTRYYSGKDGATPCPGPTQAVWMNLGDTNFDNWLYTNFFTNQGVAWKNTDAGVSAHGIPPHYGLNEDQGTVACANVVGYAPHSSQEYSSVTKGQPCNQVGDSLYAEPFDWLRAHSNMLNKACQAICAPILFNDGAPCCGDIGPCANISGGHCHESFWPDDIDDQFQYQEICNNTTGGNFLGVIWENVGMHKPVGMVYGPTIDAATTVVLMNTAARFYNSPNCRTPVTYILDYEYDFGLNGIGDITGGIAERVLSFAIRNIVPNPVTGIPDSILHLAGPLNSTQAGGTDTNEAPYFFEDTIVLYSPETRVPIFTWNGTTQTVGGGCEATSDSGGAVSLLISGTCDSTTNAGVYCEQYRNVFITKVSYGPAEVCINLTSHNKTVQNSWCVKDACSSYNYYLTPSGGELQCVPAQGVNYGNTASGDGHCPSNNNYIDLITCTSATFCNGSNSVAANMSALTIGSTTLIPCRQYTGGDTPIQGGNSATCAIVMFGKN
jgi:hypothetical protein